MNNEFMIWNPLGKHHVIKWWKNMTFEEKCNRIWFLFKWMIIFSLINSTLEMIPLFHKLGYI